MTERWKNCNGNAVVLFYVRYDVNDFEPTRLMKISENVKKTARILQHILLSTSHFHFINFLHYAFPTAYSRLFVFQNSSQWIFSGVFLFITLWFHSFCFVLFSIRMIFSFWARPLLTISCLLTTQTQALLHK